MQDLLDLHGRTIMQIGYDIPGMRETEGLA
jgi:hypothetical protein